MQIHQINTRNTKSSKKRGRGGKRGTYSGRGMKGQKSRSGGNVDPLFEGGRSSLIDRMKKIKGFKAISVEKSNVKLGDIEENFENGEIVSPKTLVRKGVLDKAKVKHGIKLIGGGTLTKKLEIKSNILLTESVKQAVEKAGGKIEILGGTDKKEEK